MLGTGYDALFQPKAIGHSNIYNTAIDISSGLYELIDIDRNLKKINKTVSLGRTLFM